MKLVFVCLCLIFGLSSADVLLSDDFEDGNADGWTPLATGASYFVNGGWYHMLHSESENCTAGSYNGDQGSVMSVADYSFLTEIYPRAGQPGAVVRYDNSTGEGYWLVMNPDEDAVALVKMSQSGSPDILATELITLSYLDYYWMRIEVSGSLLGGKIWQGTPGDEPEEWLITATDASLTSPGSICLYAVDMEPGGTATVHNDYDNIEVSDQVTLHLEGVTWGGIKALLR